MTILVTGSSGCVGSAIVLLCRKLNMPVVGVSRRASMTTDLQLDLLSTSSTTLRSIMQQIECVVHCASILPQNGQDDYGANPRLIQCILDAETERKTCTHILLSSVSVYPYGVLGNIALALAAAPSQQRSAYAYSKWQQENLLTQHPRAHILRCSSIYGFHMQQKTVLPIMLQKSIQKKALQVIGAQNYEQDFIFAEDIAQFVLFLTRHSFASSYWNMFSGAPRNMFELAQCIQSITQNNSKIFDRRSGILQRHEGYFYPREVPLWSKASSLQITPLEIGLRQCLSTL
jgi:nucleoside-diphosphate-sugar epimerase